MTRREPAGLPKATAADTVTGHSEPSGGCACLRGAKAPARWGTGPAHTSLGAHRGPCYRALASAPSAATDFGC
jgi:hypothetical protein